MSTGSCLSGLLFPIQKMSMKGFAYPLTDSPTRSRQLESEIVSDGKERDIAVMVVIPPSWSLSEDENSSIEFPRGRSSIWRSMKMINSLTKFPKLWGRRAFLLVKLTLKSIFTVRTGWTDDIPSFLKPFEASFEA